jgi:hypothetical protein
MAGGTRGFCAAVRDRRQRQGERSISSDSKVSFSREVSTSWVRPP